MMMMSYQKELSLGELLYLTAQFGTEDLRLDYNISMMQKSLFLEEETERNTSNGKWCFY